MLKGILAFQLCPLDVVDKSVRQLLEESFHEQSFQGVIETIRPGYRKPGAETITPKDHVAYFAVIRIPAGQGFLFTDTFRGTMLSENEYISILSDTEAA